VSYPGRGTFVGPEIGDTPAGQLKCIHVLLPQEYFQSSGHSCYGWMSGLSSTLPGYNIQFDFLLSDNIESHVNQLLKQGVSQGSLSALILLGCPRTVQEQVLKCGVPAVVLGTDYSRTRRLPSVDVDQYELGRLAADYMLARGHRQIALLMREMWFPGDQRMFEGVGKAMDEAGLGHSALVLRNLPADEAPLAADLQRLLATENRPTGYVCRAPYYAEALARVAKSAGLKLPGDIDVITDGRDQQVAPNLGLPSVCMKVSVHEQMAIAGKMLSQLFAGTRPEPFHVVLPVELIELKSSAHGRLKSDGRKPGAVSQESK
jgi:DNA-binding LacI/PurR family transcriptional regulator